jgi:hypothetical protein
VDAPRIIILGNPNPGQAELRTAVPGKNSSEITQDNELHAVVFVLETPYANSTQWKEGDILVAGQVQEGGVTKRLVWRYRQKLPNRRFPEYTVTELIEEVGKPRFKGIGLDPYGRLYYSDESSARRIYQLLPDSSGGFTPTNFATVPDRVNWGGEFAFDPDGNLFVSTGEQIDPGHIYKTGARAEEPTKVSQFQWTGGSRHPTLNMIHPVPLGTIGGLALALTHTANSGPICGFSFYDCDRIIYTNGSADLILASIDPSEEPSNQLSSSAVFSPPQIAVTPQTYPSLGMVPDYSVYDVAVSRSRLEDYLAAHLEVREAIQWMAPPHQDIIYDDWENNLHTKGFQQALRRLYARAGCERPIEFSFEKETDPDTNKPRIGPSLIGDLREHRVSKRDASEIYLAHLAHHLWVEVSGQVPWRLNDLGYLEKRNLLQSKRMFLPAQDNASGTEYNLSIAIIGSALPTDPVRAYHFLKGDDDVIRMGESFIKSSPKESIFALSRWIRDHLRHGPSMSLGSIRVQHYGYVGSPPMEKIYMPVTNPSDPDLGPRFWAWSGCHTAAPLIINLMRLLNIPAQLLKQYEWPEAAQETGWHEGVDFPVEELALWHADDLYAISSLKDPEIEPEAIYNAGIVDYTAYKELFADPPSSPQISSQQWAEYDKWLGGIAVRNATHNIFKFFWESILFDPSQDFQGDCQNNTDKLWRVKNQIERSWGFTHTEAITLLCDNEQVFRGRIAKFQQDHATETADLAASTSTDLEHAALNLYRQKYENWDNNR